MTIAAQLRVELITELAQLLRPHLFRLRTSQQSLTRPIPVGELTLHLSFGRSSGGQDVALDFAIQSQTVKLGLAAVGIRNYAASSVGGEIGNIFEGVPARWQLAAKSDCRAVALDMRDAYWARIVPFCDQHGTDVALLADLSSASPFLLIAPILGNRCLARIVLELHLNGADSAHATYEQCRQMLSLSAPHELQSFETFALRLLAN